MVRRIFAKEMKVEDLIGRSLRVKYEANGIDQWRLFPDGKELHLITADYVPTDLLDRGKYLLETGDNGYTVYSSWSGEKFLDWINDPAKWKKFVVGILNPRVCGGPTLEQLIGCWNLLKPLQKVETNREIYKLENPTNLFVPHENVRKRCYGYWLNSIKSGNVLRVLYNGGVGNVGSDYTNYGVRTLVTPSAETELEYDEDQGLWLIV